MYDRFPLALLSLLRCPADAGELRPEGGSPGEAALADGAVGCARCGKRYPITRGILRMLDTDVLDAESRHEVALRDVKAPGYDAEVEQYGEWDRMERGPTLAALGRLEDADVLEIGCGTGRFTVELARRCRRLVAVDFSGGSLEVLASKLAPGPGVGLVQADATRLGVASRGFDRALSTLISNLPTRSHLQAVIAMVAGALRDDGSFVLTTHNYGIKDRLRGRSREGRYAAGDIYRRLYTTAEIDAELREGFASVRTRPVQVVLPLAHRLGIPRESWSETLARVPVVRDLGALLLSTCRSPIRGEPAAGPLAS